MADGTEYWRARELRGILGYESWTKFQPVIERARAAMTTQGIDASHQIVQTDAMMERGGGAQTKGADYFLGDYVFDKPTLIE